VTDEDVLGDRQVGEQPRLLLDDGDAASPRVGRPADRHGLTVDDDRAAIGFVDAGQDLDERALAGPVLADEGVRFAGEQVERDILDGERRAEPLRDALERDAGRRRRRHPTGSGLASRATGAEAS
jgi:hypothetical protein